MHVTKLVTRHSLYLFQIKFCLRTIIKATTFDFYMQTIACPIVH